MNPRIFIWLLFLGLGCQPVTWEQPPMDESLTNSWRQSRVDPISANVQDMKVAENELILLKRNSIMRIHANGELYDLTFRNQNVIDLFTRPVFSHQFYLHKHSQSDQYISLEVIDWDLTYEGYEGDENENLLTTASLPGGDSSYLAFLNGREVGATNQRGEFIVAAITVDHPEQITLVGIDPYVWFLWEKEFEDARMWEVPLPLEAGQVPLTMAGLGDHYLVSTEARSYLLNRDGTFTELWDHPTLQAFEWENAWFAETEGELQWSQDEGASWEVWRQGASTLGEGRYYPLDSILLYAIEDRLYEVSQSSETINEISNEGLQGHQISGIVSFADSIYVGTLTGLFTKPHHDFY